MQGHQKLALFLAVAMVAGCRSQPETSAPVPLASNAESTIEGTPVGDDRTAMEAAIDVGPTSAAQLPRSATEGSVTRSAGPVLNPDAPENYVVKRGDTLWGIAKVFLRDP